MANDTGYRTPFVDHCPTPAVSYIDPLPETIGDGIVRQTNTQHAAMAKPVELDTSTLFYGPGEPGEKRGYEAISKPGGGHVLGSTR